MKNIRRNSRILGAIALTLVCLTLMAMPASASIEQVGGESHVEVESSFGSQLVDRVSGWGDGFLAFLHELGRIFAGQSGTTITD